MSSAVTSNKKGEKHSNSIEIICRQTYAEILHHFYMVYQELMARKCSFYLPAANFVGKT